MASTNNYINEYATLDEMNAAYESDHSGSWVAYCAEDNNLYYQQKTTISSKYFDNLEYNSENKTLDFYIDGEVKKSIDVSPWWFEKESYYTREEVNNKINNLTLPYSSITSTPTTLSGYGITNAANTDSNVSYWTTNAIIQSFHSWYKCAKIGWVKRNNEKGFISFDIISEVNTPSNDCYVAKFMAIWPWDNSHSGMTCYNVCDTTITDLQNRLFLSQEDEIGQQYGIYLRNPYHSTNSILVRNVFCDCELYSDPINITESAITVSYEFANKLKLNMSIS